MRRTLVLISALLLVCGLSFADTVTGYISDEGCARNGERRAIRNARRTASAAVPPQCS